MSKTLHRNLRAKMESLQGPEWDSSDEEAEVPLRTQKTDKKKTKKTQTEKSLASNYQKLKAAAEKQARKQTKAADSDDDEEEVGKAEEEPEQNVVYLGHLPNEFEELDLKNFLQQFGKVINIRISRSIKTGKSRGYAFIRMEDAETASIVAETLEGYFMGQASRRLVCHVVPNPHSGIFFNTDKIIARRKLEQQAEAKKRSRTLANADKLKTITARLVRRERKKRAKLADLGIDYDFPGFEANDADAADVEEKDQGLSTTLLLQEDAVPEEADSDAELTTQSKRNRKDSMDSNASSSSKKRKKSVDSSSSRSGKKRSDSVGSESSASKKSEKTKKSKKSKQRRESAP